MRKDEKKEKKKKKMAVEWQYMDKRTRHYVSEKVKETYDVMRRSRNVSYALYIDDAFGAQ